MFDLHSHILPGIDDGAADLETALTMLKMAELNGTTDLVLTPHVIEGQWLPAWEKIMADCRRLREEARQAGIMVTLYPGAEVALRYEILDLITGPGAYCINGGRYLLVELPALEIPSYTEDFFFKLQARGVTPILAHPARHPEIGRNPEILQDWVRKGILVQLNASSLTGKMGERVEATAELLVLNGLVHCLGSDAHGINSRRPHLATAVTKMESLIGKERTRQIVIENPGRILAGMDVETPEPTPLIFTKKTGLVQRVLQMLGGARREA